MTVSDLIKELQKIPAQTAETWIEDNYLRIGYLHIAIGRNEEEAQDEIQP